MDYLYPVYMGEPQHNGLLSLSLCVIIKDYFSELKNTTLFYILFSIGGVVYGSTYRPYWLVWNSF